MVKLRRVHKLLQAMCWSGFFFSISCGVACGKKALWSGSFAIFAIFHRTLEEWDSALDLCNKSCFFIPAPASCPFQSLVLHFDHLWMHQETFPPQSLHSLPAVGVNSLFHGPDPLQLLLLLLIIINYYYYDYCFILFFRFFGVEICHPLYGW